MDKAKVIAATETHVKRVFQDDTAGHDWQHIQRVRHIAGQIQRKEGGDVFVVDMVALLHDLDDWKLKPEGSASRVEAWLNQTGMNKPMQERFVRIIQGISFKGNRVGDAPLELEGNIVRDADRLDAMGAVGIARAFAFGGSRGRFMYNPDAAPQKHHSFNHYKQSQSDTINHFYEKLLLLNQRLATPTGKRMGKERHAFMQLFLQQFAAETEIDLPLE